MIKSFIKKYLPVFLLRFYHRVLAGIAADFYGNPSNKIIVIGITGTNGKSSTADILAKLLEAGGHNVGLASTIKFKIAKKEWLNDKKMTMVGRFQLQRLLDKMVKAGCHYAIIETTSQGIEQYRHFGINYDVVVFTNLTPEHIEAHGGFDNYRMAKGKLFEHLLHRPHKYFGGKRISKVSVINIDDEYSDYFLSFKSDWKYGYGLRRDVINLTMFRAAGLVLGSPSTFEVHNMPIKLPLCGEFNVYNALAAITVARHFSVKWDAIQRTLENFSGVAGRVESINEGQPFRVIIDYAHEPQSLKLLYRAIDAIPHNRIIHVLGSCGGGRDKARRPLLGALAAQNADIIIITNEDPYEEDPRTIMDQVAVGAYEVLGRESERIFIIEDRRDAIREAIEFAGENDLVLITGKGSEQAIVIGDKLIPWDDRVVTRELLKEKGFSLA